MASLIYNSLGSNKICDFEIVLSFANALKFNLKSIRVAFAVNMVFALTNFTFLKTAQLSKDTLN